MKKYRAMNTFPKNKTWMVTDLTLKEEVGELVFHRRITRGLTQSQLAEKCNVNQAIISKIENGKQLPSLSTLKKISEDGFGEKLRIESLIPDIGV